MLCRLLISLLLALSLTTTLQAQTAASARPTIDNNGKPFQIYVATWRGCEEVCEGFMEYFPANGIDVEFTIRNADQDESRLAEFVAEAKAMRPDLVATWGSSVTLGMIGPWDQPDPERYISDIPVVFMYASQLVESHIMPNEDSTGRPNVAGTDYFVPIESQLRAIAAYLPFDRLAVIYDTQQENSVQRVEVLRNFTEPFNFTLIAEPIPLDEEGRPDPEALPAVMERVAAQQPQFIYFGFSSFLIQNVELFTRLAVENGLPIFTAGQKPVYEADALLGLFNRLRSIGRLASYQAEQILIHEKVPGELPVARFNRYSMAINMRVARQLELYPPMLLLSYAEIIGK